MIQNLVWPTPYNLVTIPVAAGLFVRSGFDPPMSVAVMSMIVRAGIESAEPALSRKYMV